MRVIAGSRKGLKLVAFKNRDIRPTSDRTKELVFNVIRDYVPERIVLDLFAGTGSLGIEALSRGAVKAIFVENHRRAQEVILRNLEHTGLLAQAELMRVSVDVAIKRLQQTGQTVDLILADPPYAGNHVVETVTAIDRSSILAAGGWLVIEHGKAAALPESLQRLRRVQTKGKGDSQASFFRYED